MNGFSAIFRLQTESGRAVQIGDLRVIPQSRALVIRLPFVAFVWNRPIGVLVETGGQRKRVAIHNMTRLLELAPTCLILLAGLATVWRSTRRAAHA